MLHIFSFLQIPFVILILVSGAGFLFNRHKLRLSHLLLWFIFLFLALRANRNISFFCVISVMVSAHNLKALFIKSTRRTAFSTAAIILGLGLAGFLMAEIIDGRFYLRDSTLRKFGSGFYFEKYPVGAGRFLKEQGWRGKILNQMTVGGYLIWTGDPAWKVYLDGRVQVYGPETVKRHIQAITEEPVFQVEDRDYGFDAVLLDYRELYVRPLIRNLADNPDWILVYADHHSVIFLKNQPSNQKIIRQYQLSPEGILSYLGLL